MVSGDLVFALGHTEALEVCAMDFSCAAGLSLDGDQDDLMVSGEW